MRQRLLKYVFPVVCLVGLAFGQALAQDRQVSGKVTDAESGEGLPGVNVLEAGTSNGTVTDINGNYTMNVSANATLSFSFVGYTVETVAVGSRAVIDVRLALDVQSLSEVVVVGYGTQDKKEITSAVTSVQAKDFNQGTVNDPAQLLQGKVAGLSIARPGGNPNSGFAIRLRGISSVGENSSPLVVIDGVIGGSLSTVDPNDIESIDVLKDGSAAAIYGTRGSNGVLLITTKSGKAGRVSVDYNGSFGVENVARTISVMTADEYRQVPGAIDLGSSTNWLDEVTQTGTAQVHNIALAGGAAGTTYRAAVNSRQQRGVGFNSGFEQLNARLNLTQKAFNDKAVFQMNLANTSVEREMGQDAAFQYAIVSNPTLPVYDNSGSADAIRFGGYAERDIFDFFNPVSIAEQNIRDRSENRLLASIRGEYSFLDNLRVALFYSTQRETDFEGYYSPKTSKFGGGFGRNGLARVRNDERVNELFETTVNFDENFGDLNFAALGGYSYQEFFNQGNQMEAGNFLTDAFTYNNMGAALDFANGLANVFSYANSNKLVAFFGRTNFTYQGTYLLSLSARYEGSTRFGENNKWGLFPAISAGVTISNLVDIPAVNSLKARASFGRTGQQPNQSYISLQRFRREGNFFYNGAFVPTYGPASNENPNLAWETKDEFNFGIDFAMLDNKLTGAIDYYTRITRDLILPVPVPVPPNLFGSTILNIGEMYNAGLEVVLNYEVINKTDFSWSTGINLSTIQTELRSLSSGDLTFGTVNYRSNFGSPGQNATQLIRVQEGGQLGQLWGPVKVGVNEDGSPQLDDLDGDGSYCGCNDDRTQIGNAYPSFFGGINNNLRYKNFDLNLFFRGAVGHDLINSYRGFYENIEGTTVANYNVVNTKYYDESITKAEYNSSHVERADFLKLDNATLGYNLPLDPGSAFRRARFFLSAQNPFLITGYTGVDPEVRYTDGENGDPLAPGIERRNTYFTTTIWTMGVNLGF